MLLRTLVLKSRNTHFSPVLLRKFNGWATVFWLAAAPPICIFLANSIPFIVFISVYAIVTGHLSAWQGARVEVKEEKNEPKKVGFKRKSRRV